MVINRQIIEEFPYTCVFYDIPSQFPDDGKFLDDEDSGDVSMLSGDDEEYEDEVRLLETECDIQRAAKLFSDGTIMADYRVFFPFTEKKLPISFNTKFRSDDYPIRITGRVVGIEHSQLGGVVVDIKMSEV